MVSYMTGIGKSSIFNKSPAGLLLYYRIALLKPTTMKTPYMIIPLLFLSLIFHSASCQESPAENILVPFAAGINKPVCITNAGDNRLFVVDQAGYIRIIDTGGNIFPVPFLDIHDRVTYGGEQGLLGVAFHPQYSANGYFYVNYTGEGDSTHISRFTVSSGNQDLADPASEFKLMTIFQPYTNHNGGDLSFGPDGYLYIGLGDGGSAGDPGNRAQNPMEYLGKILRIDVDLGNPYAIPPTNPFYNSLSTLGEIWALGVRNPWRFSFDRLTGDLWIGDVGQNSFEEIDFQPATSPGGENYGWRCYEANQEYNSSGCPGSSAFTFPVYTYPHGPECSITGGYVYRGTSSSPYYGHYFFADYCSDRIMTLHQVAGDWIEEDFGQYPGNNFSTFGEDASGQLYVAGLTTGTIYRVLENSTGIINDDVLAGIKLIQAPFSGKIRVETGLDGLHDMHLSLYNISGSMLFNDAAKAASFEFDPGYLPAGIYFLKIGIDGRSVVKKLAVGSRQ
jgi:glucose/arabinose dehydrogenase